MNLVVFSGDCRLCAVGRPTGERDMEGRELYTGDIVMLWRGEWIGTDKETWLPSGGLTVIVAGQYTSYSDGTFEETNPEAAPFTMGIASCGVQDSQWKVTLIKSHRDSIPGERYVNFGINYRTA